MDAVISIPRKGETNGSVVIREFAEGAAYIDFAIHLKIVDRYTESPVPEFESVYKP